MRDSTTRLLILHKYIVSIKVSSCRQMFIIFTGAGALSRSVLSEPPQKPREAVRVPNYFSGSNCVYESYMYSTIFDSDT